MRENLQVIAYAMRHGALAVLGLCLVATSAVLFVHVKLKMREIGVKTYILFTRPADWGLPAKYLKVRSQHGWSPWPVYLMWPLLIVGILVAMLGVNQLHK